MSKILGIAKGLERGLVFINTGDGKGKSTASFGTVARAVGQGLKPIIIQFVKGNWRTGEQKAMEMLGVEMYQMGYGFIRIRPSHKSEEEHFAQMQATFDFAREKAATGAYDLMVLDEINVAISMGGLDPADVLRWLQAEKPVGMHVILTGRGAPQLLIDAADLVTEMKLIKHHFQAGIGAVRGLEF
jgi:cob(I)alamin adenosyltransferase